MEHSVETSAKLFSELKFIVSDMTATDIFIVSDTTATDIPRRIDPELSPQGRSFRPSATSPGGRPYP